MGNVGGPELVLVLLVAVLLFGGSKLPDLGSSVGRAIREFKHGLSGDDDSIDRQNTP